MGDPLQSRAISAEDQLVDQHEAEAQRRERGRGRLEIGGLPCGDTCVGSVTISPAEARSDRHGADDRNRAGPGNVPTA